MTSSIFFYYFGEKKLGAILVVWTFKLNTASHKLS